ncbi:MULTISPECIES: hypothetical protein [unclassified Rhodococcus (in: high G+C Gram-positive bacteria)]|jgi:hypothetical protein|nr:MULTISPECIES: hypothetical protein [unclassified Rhodococcus (in: high G+C Gram-positive bacteria)]MBP1158880.1 hypothetical protein [Rhodococcus sp. PvR099]PTR38524.1 hypothetical protein C8K38_1179 [Rhodococcus sp. OK611]SNX92895.1 hypothetical protein SAMN05447004_1179 [Rhodococcus sp. OK270]
MRAQAGDWLVVSATEMFRRQEHERERIAKLQRLIGETAAQGGEIT